jgi:hypothetical protein
MGYPLLALVLSAVANRLLELGAVRPGPLAAPGLVGRGLDLEGIRRAAG